MIPDLNQLRCFAYVARHESFTVAAKKLGIPKSGVSRAVANLESRLGLRLIRRTTRNVALTEAGELYRTQCERMLEEAEQAELVMAQMHGQPKGRLRIGAPVAYARFVLAPLLPSFLKRYPAMDLSLHLADGTAASGESNLDVVIRPGPIGDSSSILTPVYKIQLGVYASPKYLDGKILPKTPAGLKDLDCITTGCGTHGEPVEKSLWRLRKGNDSQEIRLESRVSVPDPTINYQLVVAGSGVALLSKRVAAPDVAAGRLLHLLPDWEPASVELYAVYPSRLNSSPKVRAFVEFLREHPDGDGK
jgi:DNA-binding transcriptional LysR family regulator